MPSVELRRTIHCTCGAVLSVPLKQVVATCIHCKKVYVNQVKEIETNE